LRTIALLSTLPEYKRRAKVDLSEAWEASQTTHTPFVPQIAFCCAEIGVTRIRWTCLGVACDTVS